MTSRSLFQALAVVLLIFNHKTLMSQKLPCKLHKNGYQVLMMTATNGYLDMLVRTTTEHNGTMYLVDLKTTNVDSYGRRLKLFAPGYKTEDSPLFETINWLRPVPEYLKKHNKRLVKLNLIARKYLGNSQKMSNYAEFLASPDPGGNGDVGGGDGLQLTPAYYFVMTKKGVDDVVKLRSKLAERFVVVSDNKYGGFVWILPPAGPSSSQSGHRLNGSILATIDFVDELKDSKLLMPAIPFTSSTTSHDDRKINPDIKYLLATVTNITSGSSKSSSPPQHRLHFTKLAPETVVPKLYDSGPLPPPEYLPADHFALFGFLFGGVVHLIDFHTGSAYLFNDPSAKITNNKSKPITARLHTVPLDEYFACTEEEWQRKDISKPDDDEVNKIVAIISQYALPASIALGALILTATLAAACLCVRKRRRTTATGATVASESFQKPRPVGLRGLAYSHHQQNPYLYKQTGRESPSSSNRYQSDSGRDREEGEGSRTADYLAPARRPQASRVHQQRSQHASRAPPPPPPPRRRGGGAKVTRDKQQARNRPTSTSPSSGATTSSSSAATTPSTGKPSAGGGGSGRGGSSGGGKRTPPPPPPPSILLLNTPAGKQQPKLKQKQLDPEMATMVMGATTVTPATSAFQR
ncbi:hypothetical protein TYRP_014746 [Tyrophagus putrescentiae]|nr:hypothetical protein TYRP_014746 [Tyrophagus putrescentiae]